MGAAEVEQSQAPRCELGWLLGQEGLRPGLESSKGPVATPQHRAGDSAADEQERKQSGNFLRSRVLG